MSELTSLAVARRAALRDVAALSARAEGLRGRAGAEERRSEAARREAEGMRVSLAAVVGECVCFVEGQRGRDQAALCGLYVAWWLLWVGVAALTVIWGGR
jgi:hypothetical protein